MTKSFNRYLKEYEVTHFDIGQIEQVLMGKVESDILVVILDESFTLQRVDFLEQLLKKFRQNNSAKLIVSNIFKTYSTLTTEINVQHYKSLLNINERINSFTEIADTTILNIYHIVQLYGFNTIYNIKNALLFQTPFTKKGFELIASELTNTIELFYIKRKKVIVLDADNTLWGGIIGEDGVDGIKCDENYPGIIYKRFQQQLKELLDSGVILCMVSKNNFHDVKELFEKRKMPLSWDDFLIKKINWMPKSQNIREIAQEINVGLESLLFIDDSDFEIHEVSTALRIDTLQVSTVNLIENLKLLEDELSLKAIRLTQEDRDKLNQYRAEQKRSEVFKDISSIDEFIESLNIKIDYWINNKTQIKRVTQLINKTNQFNLTTKRYSESEVLKMMDNDKVFSFKVEDKFGDMGIVSVVIVKDNTIDTFLMSCRVLGRKIEDKVINIVLDNVQLPLKALYIASEKNSQVEKLYEKLGFDIVDKNRNMIRYIKEKI
jgi:FkbH-like protein